MRHTVWLHLSKGGAGQILSKQVNKYYKKKIEMVMNE
jgi:hypothetical protein